MGVFIETGDRWRRNSRYSRADNLFLTIIVSPVLASQGEVALVATDDSDLDLEWTPSGGTLRFAGLRPSRRILRSSRSPSTWRER